MSAVSPAPLPPEDEGGTAEGRADQRPGPGGRPTLSIAPDTRPAGRREDAPVQREPSGTPHVRLVPLSEPPAVVLRTEAPAHVRPPVLGSPSALARPRPSAGIAERENDVLAAPLPDPTRLCCGVVLAAVEGLRGVRPLAQLVRWVTPEVYERLALRAHLVQHAAVPPAVGRAGIRRVRVCRLGDSAAEATVVVDDGPRVRAVALRVEEHRGRWRATVLEIG
jgi:Family of unknown function (DUF6459)